MKRKHLQKRPEGWMKDTTPESWCCIDCGFNTHPGSPTRAEMERLYETQDSISITIDTRCEVYMVHVHVWQKAGMSCFGGCLCIGCLEKRIDRRLIPDDFSDHIFNTYLPGTQRLLERQGRYDPLGDWNDEAA